jgi:hypothetical protein
LKLIQLRSQPVQEPALLGAQEHAKRSGERQSKHLRVAACLAVVEEQQRSGASEAERHDLALALIQIGDEAQQWGLVDILHGDPRQRRHRRHRVPEPRTFAQLERYRARDRDPLVQRRQQLEPAELVQVQQR